MKKLLLGIGVIVLICILLWPENVTKISEIESGNTVVLSNGATVRLLGLSPTEEAKSELTLYRNKEVRLVADKGYYFNVDGVKKGDIVDAYIVCIGNDNDKRCINSEILKSGLAPFVENVRDSLYEYRRYAEQGLSNRGGAAPKVVSNVDYQDDDIHLDPYVPSGERKHSAWYVDGNMNLDMLEEACDFNLPYTKKFANELAARSPGPFNPRQICEIYAYCNRKWSYVNDPADSEYVARASESISCSLVGDCDDFAVLMASCILAIGGRPCINTGVNSQGGHAFAEVDIAQFNELEVLEVVREFFPAYDVEKLNCRRDGEHNWLNLDWQSPFPGGDYYDCSLGWNSYPYLNGHWEWRRLR
ncbi:MAG: hypothetical protein IKU93_04650 [Alistipes sp.]|nr:hypothetical protein [Alistipes sp.]